MPPSPQGERDDINRSPRRRDRAVQHLRDYCSDFADALHLPSSDRMHGNEFKLGEDGSSKSVLDRIADSSRISHQVREAPRTEVVMFIR